MCNCEKHIEEFFKKHTECKNCNTKRNSQRYYENKDKISIQQKTHYEKNRDKLLQKQNNTHNYFKEFLRSYVESENKLKELEESFLTIDSENNQNYITNKTNVYLFHDLKLNRFILVCK